MNRIFVFKDRARLVEQADPWIRFAFSSIQPTDFAVALIDSPPDCANSVWTEARISLEDIVARTCDRLHFITGTLLLRHDLVTEVCSSNGDVVVALHDEAGTDAPGTDGNLWNECERLRRLLRTKAVYVSFNNSCGGKTKRVIESMVETGRAVATVQDLVVAATQSGASIAILHAKGKCAVAKNPSDIARFVLGSKADTLERLRPLLRKSQILPGVSISLGHWQLKHTDCITQVQDAFPLKELIIRSSATSEDGWAESNAGGYDSVLGVSASDSAGIRAAIDKVFRSYKNAEHQDRVLVQPMLSDVAMSGVVLTRTLGCNAPYYVVNAAEGDTTAVTSGSDKRLLTTVALRHHEGEVADNKIRNLLDAVKEIENLIGCDALDIEFAITPQAEVYIFQVRPIAKADPSSGRDDSIRLTLAKAKSELELLTAQQPGLLGERSVFGVMPDAHPAELIGLKPRPLAFSLYRHLVTDDVAGAERAAYGYIDTRPYPLMVSVAGHPYVDVRVSFNSLTPAGLPPSTTHNIVCRYIDLLATNTQLHDKVEFEVLITGWYADVGQHIHQRLGDCLTTSESKILKERLAAITNAAVLTTPRRLHSLSDLSARFDVVMASVASPLLKARLLIEDAKRLGAGIFVHTARSSFIAVSILRSLVRAGVISPSDLENFFASLNTVTKKMEMDALEVQHGRMSLREFVKTYGHLRPGTYDVSTPAYFDDIPRYIEPIISSAHRHVDTKHEWSAEQAGAIGKVLDRELKQTSVESFDQFCRLSIAGRETAKFLYTRNLSYGLKYLRDWSTDLGIAADDIGFLTWSDITQYAAGTKHADRTEIAELVLRAKESQKTIEALELPALLSGPNDLFVFERGSSEPNFVTTKKATAAVTVLADDKFPSVNLDGKIVLIPRADPGFDWLFSYKIAGLITMYGGGNSHMAIRAAEHRLPAAIGVGEQHYKLLSGAQTISLNCENRTVKALR